MLGGAAPRAAFQARVLLRLASTSAPGSTSLVTTDISGVVPGR